MSLIPGCTPRNLTAVVLPPLWGWDGWYVIANLVVMFTILMKDWIRTEFAMLFCSLMIYSAQITTVEEAFIGFSNSGVLTVLVLYVVAEGLSATGGVDYFMSKVMGEPKTVGVALIRMCIPVAFTSAFINNTPLVALMIPIIDKWSRKVKIPPSLLQMPLSFATILGGTVTMIGTSTNLVVAGRARVFYCRNINLFELSPAGVPNAFAGIAYIILFAPILLPGREEYERRRRLAILSPQEREALRRKQLEKSWYGRLWNKIRGQKKSHEDDQQLIEVDEIVGEEEIKKDGNDNPALALTDDNNVPVARAIPLSLAREATGYILNAVVLNDSPVVGRTVTTAGLRGQDGLYLISVQRGNTLYSAIGGNFVIEAGDLVSFTGPAQFFPAFTNRLGLSIVAIDDQDPTQTLGSKVPDSVVNNTVEAIIREGSWLIGKTVKEADFRTRYGAAILSIYRAGQRLRPQKIGPVQLKIGDVLLLVTNENFSWQAPETSRDLRPRHDAEQARLIRVQDDQRDSQLDELTNDLLVDRIFYFAMKVADSSKLGSTLGAIAGRTIEQSGVRAVPGVVLFAVQREDATTGNVVTHRVVGPDFLLQGGDILWYSGERDGLSSVRRLPGLTDVDARQIQKLRIATHHRRLVEVVLSLRSDMLYKTVRESRFRSRYNAAIVAIHRQGAPVLQTLGDIVLQPGDVLILDCGPTFVPNFRDDPNFLLLTELDQSYPPRFDKFYLALVTSILMIILAAVFDKLNMLLFALWASFIMLVSGCLTGDRAMKSLNWGVIITVACAFGLSTALEKTYVAPIFGNAFVSLALLTKTGEIGVLATIILSTTILSSLVANNAAALLMFPIAAQAGAGLGIAQRKVLYALMFGASDYATPFGYQTNLMVMGPGGYVFSDYVKFGAPMMVYLLVWQVIIIALIDNWYIMALISLGFLVSVCLFDLSFRGGVKFHFLDRIKGVFGIKKTAPVEANDQA